MCFLNIAGLHFSVAVPEAISMSAADAYIKQMAETYSKTRIAKVLKRLMLDDVITIDQWANLTKIAIKRFSLRVLPYESEKI